MKKNFLLLILVSLCSHAFSQTVTTFTFTGSVQSYTVPSGVSQLGIDMEGGCGGEAYYYSGGSNPVTYGGRVQCTLAVTPGNVYYIYVGGSGTNWSCCTNSAGGFNGGGTAGTYAAAGGGASDIRTSASGTSYTNRILVAGGGGGGGDFSEAGGAGGGATGGTATGGATGGSQTGAGSGCGGSGSGAVGGPGESYSGGGGGGGYFGGGGGCGDGGGGGGSSYPASSGGNVTGLVLTQGYTGANGNGQVTITALCNAIGTITGTVSVCVGATTSLSNTVSGTWYSSNTAVATVSSSGVVTGVSAGTVTIIDSVNTPCSGLSARATVTVNGLPSSITGPSSGCPSALVTLSCSPSGGTWSSSNSTIASINSSTGIITDGSGTGTVTIGYTAPDGCGPSTLSYTVNSNPAAITGAASICGGTAPGTVTLHDATSGGSWSSSNTLLATVGSSSGIVTGVGNGTPTITYTLPTGCIATSNVTVNTVSAISGLPSICLGSGEVLTDPYAPCGGTWSSSNVGVGSITSSGVFTSASTGSTVISYTASCNGCSALMTLNVTTATPGVYTVTGGGSYCSGGSGVHVGLSSSDAGVTYSLFNGATLVTTVTGTGSSIDFGTVTLSGTYNVVANYGTSCATNMSGSASVSITALPTAYSVAGGGSYCSGGTGLHVTLNSSSTGVSYQLMLGTTPVGSPLSGTGSSLDFGAQTTAGTYTVIATSTSTSCSGAMSGSAVISINALPVAFSVTGGGGYCTGGSGVHIGLASSTSGISYQLMLSGSPVGSSVTGSGGSIDFGAYTTVGTYTIVATNTSTECSATMSGSAVVSVNPLPTAFIVTGGGSYCPGGTGVGIGLNGSSSGVNYQLYNGSSSVGAPVAGTGTSFSFGLQTATGSYTVVATNATTGCMNTMASSASVSLSALPTAFTVTGGGGYCSGGTGVPVGLSGSISGTTYYLYNGTTLVGAASGVGSSISFGTETAPGTYTVIATNPGSGCSGSMSGSVSVVINQLPLAFTVSGSGSYCAGGSGLPVTLSSSSSGINYQLYNGTTAVGTPHAGTGGSISFGSQTAAGTYTVMAVNATSGCSNNMLGSALITINPLPVVYAITGGGPYCTGGFGVHVGVASSNTGISYQLTNGGFSLGSPITGTGSALDFGVLTASGTYSVTATNTSTGCSVGMGGSAVISINPLPAAYAVTNGGSYCAGSSGAPVGLNGSTAGINYQLYNGLTPVGSLLAGTGTAFSFGPQTIPGTYTVVASNATTGCSVGMTGSVAVSINPLPALFAVTGGGGYCTGGSGSAIGLSGSASGINYILMNGSSIVSTMAGTGSAISFGPQTAPGTYTVVASNPSTSCSNNMSGSAAVVVNAVPALFTVTGGGGYCAGGAGVHIGLSGSASGISYQLLSGITPVGTPVPGTGFALSFGSLPAGTYSVVATNTSSGCSAAMTGSATVTSNPLPVLHTVTGGGSYCAGGMGVTIGLDGSATGTNYQLYNGSTPVDTAVAGSTGFPITFGAETAAGTYTVIATNTGNSCSVLMTGSAAVVINPLPAAYSVTGGGNYCSGGAGVHVGLNNSASGIMYQLVNGTSLVGAPLSGTGGVLDFGLQTSTGAYTVSAIDLATGCAGNMSGSAIVGTNPLPAMHNVTGGGGYCVGGAGVNVGIDGSDAGINYQLYNGVATVGGTVAGTGAAINFGAQTATGSYTIVAANATTGCSVAMSGSAVVSINPLPNSYTLLGGGSYCTGGTGVDISLNGTDPGTSYQLYNGTALVGASLTGTGLAIDFGLQSAAGTYTVVATNLSTSCTANMSNSVTVSVNAIPAVFSVTGGGNYCLGGTGASIMLSGSAAGVSYQLSLGGRPLGSAVTGTGGSISFGPQTSTGTYTVIATSGLGCTNTMAGTATIGTTSLPNVYGMGSSGTTYCAGGSGIDVTLSGSDPGVSYQLFNGTSPAGSLVSGTGSLIDFGHQFAAGTYSVIATNGAGCSSTMTGHAFITVNALPNAYMLTGGGGYCAGSAGVHIGLSGSDGSISYQLYRGLSLVTTVTGTSGPINFGLQTVAGTYTVVAENTSTTCSSGMTGSVAVAINPLPVVYSVTGGGAYCSGGAGMAIGLSNSTGGVSYQLYRSGTIPVGTGTAGSGTALNFGPQTAAGTYTIVATNTATGCSSAMGGNAIITVNPSPSVYTVTGGGGFCAGGVGIHVGVSGSGTGISYQLYNGLSMSGSAVSGSGSSIDFGAQTAGGTYTVVATNTSTGCTAAMSGLATVVVNPLPSVYSVVGGGSFCAGGSGVHVGVNNSGSGISYELMNGHSSVATVTGSGGPLDFGLQTSSGTYTVVAENTATGCSAAMSDSAVVTVVPISSPYVTITNSKGSDTVCAGAFITFTANPTSAGSSPAYQWIVNGVIAGAGATYAYIPNNGDVISVMITSNAACASPTSADASATMTVDPVEAPQLSISANPGDLVCQNTAVTFTAVPSYGGNAPQYAWYKNSTPTGITSPTYTYIPANGDVVYATMTSNYLCRLGSTAASSNIKVTVDLPTVPEVSITASPGLRVAVGETVTFTADVNNAGPSPAYQWMVDAAIVPGATNATYTTNSLFDGDQVSCQVTSSGPCPDTSGTASVSVHIVGTGVAQVAAAGSDVKVLPNPNKGVFTVKGTLGTVNDEEVMLQVTDMVGNVVYSARTLARNGVVNEQVNMAGSVANGMYILTLRSGSGTEVFHVVMTQ